MENRNSETQTTRLNKVKRGGIMPKTNRTVTHRPQQVACTCVKGTRAKQQPTTLTGRTHRVHQPTTDVVDLQPRHWQLQRAQIDVFLRFTCYDGVSCCFQFLFGIFQLLLLFLGWFFAHGTVGNGSNLVVVVM